LGVALEIHLGLVTRQVLTFAIGCLGLVWGIFILPSSEATDALRDFEDHLLRAETFNRTILTERLESSASQSLSACDSHSQTALLLIEMSLAETALRSGAASEFDQRVHSLESRSRRILSCTPRESFVWLLVFNLDVLHGVLNEHSFKLLAMSYETSPNEAWISIRRILVAAPLLRIAPEPLQRTIFAEFRQLIRDGFVTDAARAYLSAPLLVRSSLQTNIEQLNAPQQKAFLNALQNLRS
jgi:hypothetical protein